MEINWRDFKPGRWQTEIDVRDFINSNYQPYSGSGDFLAGPSKKTRALWQRCEELLKKEQEKDGVLDVDTSTVSGITGFAPGYVDRSLEVIVGLQTDTPLKRPLNPFGGIRMAREAAEAYGYSISEDIERVFTKYRKTHNQGVFEVYTPEMLAARKTGVITGLPDSYGRGRIIGDYRRAALYGVDRLIEAKRTDLNALNDFDMDEDIIRLREEIGEQVGALEELKTMALDYGHDISRPAGSALEAVQWLYFAYLASIKEQNGAAMSLGRTGTFLDIYFERDLNNGVLTEEEAQEIIDQLVIKLRLVRQLRTPEYNELFAGDPNWVTEAVGGMGSDGRTLVTRTSYRFLQTLYNLGPSTEPNLTVLWSQDLPENFKRFCTRVSLDTSAIQYENDDLMRSEFGDDYSIACCVSAMKTGKQVQFFGARCNLAKVLLLAINQGRDEITGCQVAPSVPELTGDCLDYDEVMERFELIQDWLCRLYVNTMNVIHFMHDRYAYERVQMALHDTHIERLMAFGLAGLSVAADSLSAIKFAEVRPVRDHRGIAVDFTVKGDFPKFGNDDDRVDGIAVKLVEKFGEALKKYRTYRRARHTLSVLTITSNVVYGEKTGSTPDGRKKGEPFAPGANPMHGRDASGALASLNSVAKLPYQHCLDGISNTFSVVPETLGRDRNAAQASLMAILTGYFRQGGHHLNVNVLKRSLLKEAMERPELYPRLTIRVSGYAVNFTRLTRAQQLDVLYRTIHDKVS